MARTKKEIRASVESTIGSGMLRQILENKSGMAKEDIDFVVLAASRALDDNDLWALVVD